MKTHQHLLPFLCLALSISLLPESNAQQEFFREDFSGAIPPEWTVQTFTGNGGDFSEWLWTIEGP